MIALLQFKHALWAIALIIVSTLTSVPVANAQQCGEEQFEGARYTICTIDPATSDLRLFWKGADDLPFRSFANLARATKAQGQDLVFAINAGMYQSDFTPLGLYVENGDQLRPADTSVLEGAPRQIPNFYKQPNGVFFLGEAGAGILTTERFLADRPAADFATQSGPMLVIEEALHPALIAGSTDRTRRSGVGVCQAGTVRFAISRSGVNFHDFARLFRDHLACPNALFLDGGRGAGLYLPEIGRNDFSWHGGYGPIFGVIE